MPRETLSRVVRGDCGLRQLSEEAKLRRIHHMYKEVEITEEEYRRELAETKERLGSLLPPQETKADELLRAGEYLETLGPVWEAATPQERKEMYQLVFEMVYVDVLEKKLMKVVPKGAFSPLFGEVRPRRVTKFSGGL